MRHSNSKKNLNRDILHNLYVVKGMTREQVATELGVGSTTVLKYMVKFDIPRRTTSDCIRGKPKSAEHRAKLSESRKGSKNPNFGKKMGHHGRRCWYTMPDGRVVSMRSQWEVWYAEYLRENGINFDYEPTTFIMKDGNAYTPDFLLIDSGEYVEVKGWFTIEAKQKLSKFGEERPDIKVILADKNYLQSLGIDLRRKWIAEQPKFPCEGCGELFCRPCPEQRFCSVVCRNRTNCYKKGSPKTSAKVKRNYKGTQSGERNNSAKISKDNAMKILEMRFGGSSYKEIASLTGASLGNIYNIISGRSWKELPRP